MKTSYIIGAIALFLAGGTVAWGVHEYLLLKDQVSEIQKEAHSTSSTPSPSPSSSPSAGATTASVLPNSSPSPSPSPVLSFEALSLCAQLDSIDKGGKKVYEFIVNSGKFDKFAAEVPAKCNWHADQLKQAESILFPPVASEPPASDSEDDRNFVQRPRRNPIPPVAFSDPDDSASSPKFRPYSALPDPDDSASNSTLKPRRGYGYYDSSKNQPSENQPSEYGSSENQPSEYGSNQRPGRRQ